MVFTTGTVIKAIEEIDIEGPSGILRTVIIEMDFAMPLPKVGEEVRITYREDKKQR